MDLQSRMNFAMKRYPLANITRVVLDVTMRFVAARMATACNPGGGFMKYIYVAGAVLFPQLSIPYYVLVRRKTCAAFWFPPVVPKVVKKAPPGPKPIAKK